MGSELGDILFSGRAKGIEHMSARPLEGGELQLASNNKAKSIVQELEKGSECRFGFHKKADKKTEEGGKRWGEWQRPEMNAGPNSE